MTAPDGDGRHWRRVVAAAAVLLVGSTIPNPFREGEAFGVLGPDKLLHLVGHGGFAAALARALDDGSGDLARGALAAAVSAAYGHVLGRLQAWVPGRGHERADVLAGTVGSVLGVLLWAWRRGESGEATQ